VGALKVRATTHDMRKATKLDRKIAQKEASRRRERPETEREDSITPPKSPGLELDLRGQRVEGALRSLDEYIDAAYLSGLPFARIIHGKGTGALRKAIRDMLDSHALIIKVAEANPNEGGAGVTIIYMSTESR
jgi:DNA mismatch repair protein MutS2